MDAFFGIIIIAIAVMVFFLYQFKQKSQSKMAEALPDNFNESLEEIYALNHAKTTQLADPVDEPFIDKDHTILTIPDETDTHFAMTEGEQSLPQQLDAELIVINVFAKSGSYFASYDLLQAISATGMQFGAMNIFHYYEKNQNRKAALFSLASATEPGEFDLNRLGDFSCRGLSLFMDIHQVPNAEDTFAHMLDTAEQLAEDLDGELWAGPNTPWNEDIMQRYQQKVLAHPNQL